MSQETADPGHACGTLKTLSTSLTPSASGPGSPLWPWHRLRNVRGYRCVARAAAPLLQRLTWSVAMREQGAGRETGSEWAIVEAMEKGALEESDSKETLPQVNHFNNVSEPAYF